MWKKKRIIIGHLLFRCNFSQKKYSGNTINAASRRKISNRSLILMILIILPQLSGTILLCTIMMVRYSGGRCTFTTSSRCDRGRSGNQKKTLDSYNNTPEDIISINGRLNADGWCCVVGTLFLLENIYAAGRRVIKQPASIMIRRSASVWTPLRLVPASKVTNVLLEIPKRSSHFRTGVYQYVRMNAWYYIQVVPDLYETPHTLKYSLLKK